MMERFLDLVDPTLYPRSGSVFYSGRSAFAGPAPVYLLGLNPGGSPITQASETIATNIDQARHRIEDDWSAYVDEPWNGREPGAHGMQARIQHLFKGLGLDPRHVPSSNVIFTRTARESDLRTEAAALLARCWPVHDAVIEELSVGMVICLGRTAGAWVCERIGAHRRIDEFVECNRRKWRSQVHANAAGRLVATLTHPSIADWTAAAADPTPMVLRALTGQHGFASTAA